MELQAEGAAYICQGTEAKDSNERCGSRKEANSSDGNSCS